MKSIDHIDDAGVIRDPGRLPRQTREQVGCPWCKADEEFMTCYKSVLIRYARLQYRRCKLCGKKSTLEIINGRLAT